jgi:hypothetical protein
MHDVGKSGWFIFVPLYNLYLLVQPAVEKGRIPNWVLAERVSFVFVVILISRLFVNGFKDTDAIISLFFWTFFFVATRLKNQRAKNTQGENGLVEWKMKPLPIASLAPVLALSGCSNTETGISPQEKRNNFDACLIQYHKQNQTSQGISSYRDQLADEACAYLLE